MPFKTSSSELSSGSKRSVLGRGLDNLFPPLAHSKPLVWLGIEELEPGPHQPRQDFDKESLKELSLSIRQNGMIQPIVAKKSGRAYKIMAGERRWRAAGLAGQKKVPVWLWEGSPVNEAALALVENLHRQNLNPIELALAYKTILAEQKWTQEQLADCLSLPRASLANYLRLLNLPGKVQAWLRSGKLTMAHAKLLLSQKSPALQLKWARYFITHSSSVQQAARLLSKSPVRSKPLISWQKQALQKIQDSHGIKAHLHFKKKGGDLSLRFYSDEQLQAILDLLL